LSGSLEVLPSPFCGQRSAAMVAGASGVGFLGWVEGRYVKPSNALPISTAQPVAPPFPLAQVQVLHVWQTGCPCNGGHQTIWRGPLTRALARSGVMSPAAGRAERAGCPMRWRHCHIGPLPADGKNWPGLRGRRYLGLPRSQLSYVGPISDGAHLHSDSQFYRGGHPSTAGGRPGYNDQYAGYGVLSVCTFNRISSIMPADICATRSKPSTLCTIRQIRTCGRCFWLCQLYDAELWAPGHSDLGPGAAGRRRYLWLMHLLKA